ncbi:MAG: hypothetical protein MUE54_07005 [Anaerolineae bacterium]|jgi:hypothetical protein|nr:hypothetical protein [Anaerolineae bacterium]
MTHSPKDDSYIENLLDSLTNAVLMEQDVDALIQDQPQNPELTSLVDVIRKLSLHLSGFSHQHAPEEAYMQSLKQDLIGTDDTMLSRLRAVPLPLRVQIATGLAAIVAGIMFIIRRRMNDGDDNINMEEIPAIN